MFLDELMNERDMHALSTNETNSLHWCSYETYIYYFNQETNLPVAYIYKTEKLIH